MKTLVTVLAVSALLSGSAVQAQPAKTLAAPAAEILDGSLRLPSPEQATTRSTSALVPVELQADGRQMSWNAELPIGLSTELEVMLLAPDGQLWSLDVAQPGMDLQRLDRTVETTTTVDHRTGALGAELGANIAAEIYTFSNPVAGDWNLSVRAPFEADRPGVDGYLLLADDSTLTQVSHLTSYDLLLGREVGVVTSLVDSASDRIQAVEMAMASITTPSGLVIEMPMHDDGKHADGAAGDGVFGFLMEATEIGDHTVRVTLLGADAMGQRILRSSQHLMPILEPSVAFAGEALAEAADERRLAIHVELQRTSKHTPAEVLAQAELWGAGPAGDMQPVAFLGGMQTLVSDRFTTEVTLDLDGRWIALADVSEPFELRNLRLADRDTFIPLARIDRLELDVVDLPASAWGKAPEQIDATMLMGERPVQQSKAGSGIVLSHGYCSSSNNWPSSHFTGEAKFLDPNANRSHDQFARLLRDFGAANFSSFGLIAHSQGGAASLHLYTYYWSGLDYSSGQRLIQSVGTPYQGSGLAGTVAALGGVFGIQCGSTFDLTYDGASLWLSGIPSWARSRVTYHTTSFTDKWWRYDYCNIGSDLLLSDPEDGVVEKWAGQLPGANNGGHKTGWCHTTDMRDPGQTQDYSRNSVMNSKANR